MSGWSPKPLIRDPFLITINQVAVPIAPVTSIFAGGAMEGMVIGLFVTGIAGTCTVQLQHSFGRDVWSNVTGKVTPTLVNGWNFIKIHHDTPADAALLPLYDVMRLVLTSNGTGAGSIVDVRVLQES